MAGSLVTSLLEPAHISVETIVAVALVHLTVQGGWAWQMSVVCSYNLGAEILLPRGAGTAAAMAQEAERSWMITENFIVSVGVGSSWIRWSSASNFAVLEGCFVRLVFGDEKGMTASCGYLPPYISRCYALFSVAWAHTTQLFIRRFLRPAHFGSVDKRILPARTASLHLTKARGNMTLGPAVDAVRHIIVRTRRGERDGQLQLPRH